MNSSFLQRKKITLIALLIVFCILGGYSITFVRAQASLDTITAIYVQTADAVKKISSTGDLVEQVSDKFEQTKTMSDSESGAFTGAMLKFATTAAQGLVGIYFLINLIREAMRGDPSMDFWFKIFAVYMLTAVLLINWNTIIKTVENIGWDLKDSITGSVTTSGVASDDYDNPKNIANMCADSVVQIMVNEDVIKQPNKKGMAQLKKATIKYWKTGKTDAVMKVLDPLVINDTWQKNTSLSAMLLMISFTEIGILCAIDGQVFFLAMQIVLRRSLAPIAIANISMEGARSGAVRYLKRYFALYVQIAIIIMLAMAFTQMITTVITAENGALPKIYHILACQGTMMAAISQSGQLAQEVLGD